MEVARGPGVDGAGSEEKSPHRSDYLASFPQMMQQAGLSRSTPGQGTWAASKKDGPAHVELGDAARGQGVRRAAQESTLASCVYLRGINRPLCQTIKF